VSEKAIQTPLQADESQPPTFSEFLATVAPGQLRTVNLLAGETHEVTWNLSTPEIKLFCDHADCNKETFFDSQHSGASVSFDQFVPKFLIYRCRHCKQSSKLFALLVKVGRTNSRRLRGEVEKIGEHPVFGPHVPTRVNKLIGPDRDFFFKGRRAESQGMGIGAFGYYRRVVENQKNRIIDEIIRVCERIGAAPNNIKELERAKAEVQFSKAVRKIRKGIPDVLKINGHNPLLLLHHALSEGMHAQDDEQCLELATSIRVLMTELAERLDQALKEEAELRVAVSRLLRDQTKKREKTVPHPPVNTTPSTAAEGTGK
jgi:hypothetical protein